MAFNKIQPQQIQLPTFFSNSGNLIFTDNSTGVAVELSTGINGKINFLSGLLSAGVEVLRYSSNANLDINNGNIALGTSGSLLVTGYHNTVIGGQVDALSGIFNTVINTTDIVVGNNTRENTVIGGDTVTISNSITGSLAIFSSDFIGAVDQSQTIFLGATSGLQILSDTEFDVGIDVTINDNLNVLNTGFFDYINLSSSLDVTGDVDITGNLFTKTNLSVSGISTLANLNVDNWIDANYLTGVTGTFTSGITVTGSTVATQNWTYDNFYSTGLAASKYFLTGGLESQWLFTGSGSYLGADTTGAIYLNIAGSKFKITGQWLV